jgi:hypothetical protein
MPDLPQHQDFRRQVKAKAYQVVEHCGLVWVHMGRRAEAPPMVVLRPQSGARNLLYCEYRKDHTGHGNVQEHIGKATGMRSALIALAVVCFGTFDHALICLL